MIDKKKLKDVMKKQDLKQEKPTDPSMTLDVKNEDVEAQIDLYLKEKTGENLNALIELMRTRRVLVPANLNDEKKPVPCLINSPKNGMFLPIYTSKKSRKWKRSVKRERSQRRCSLHRNSICCLNVSSLNLVLCQSAFLRRANR